MNKLIEDFLIFSGLAITPLEMQKLRAQFALYGLACVHDSEYRKEAEKVLSRRNGNGL